MLKKFLIVLLFLFLFPLFSSTALAQVVINEFSSSTSSDWVELYAYEDTDISGWELRDTIGVIFTIENEVSIGPSTESFFVRDVSNRLNKPGDIVGLYRPDDSNPVDQIPYGNEGGVCIPEDDGSIGRVYQTDQEGTNLIERFSNNTKGVSNVNNILDSCPTPTPVLTSTPTPTQSPTRTPTPQPTSTPKLTNTPTLKPTIKVKKTPTPTVEEEEEENYDTLGTQEMRENTPTPAPESEDEDEKKLPIVAGILMVFGVGFMAVSAFVFMKGRKKGL